MSAAESQMGAGSGRGRVPASRARAAHICSTHAEAPVCAIIVSGGTGSRFGNPGGKQLVDIDGRPLMSWSIAAFDASALVGHIVVVCPMGRHDEVQRRAIEPYGFQTPISYADAGPTRQASTRSGLDAVPAQFNYVAVHDGARPLITVETIDRAIEALRADASLAGVVCGQPAIDTLKIVDAGGRIEGTPDRSRFWTVQTPQVFTVKALHRAFELADREGFVGTDDASIVERAGGAVVCVESPRDNLKVTVPEDLSLVEQAMRRRHS